MPFKVLILPSNFPRTPDGMDGNYIVHQAEALMRLGNTVRILVATPWTPGFLQEVVDDSKREVDCSAFRALGLNVSQGYYFSLPRRKLGIFALPMMYVGLSSEISKIVRREGIEIIHAHSEELAYVAARVGEDLGTELVVTLHANDPEPSRYDTEAKRRQLAYGLLAAKCSLLVGTGTPSRHYFETFAPIEANYKVVTTGFRIPEGLKPSPRIPKRAQYRVIIVANLRDDKGHELLIQAIARLARLKPGLFELVCVGDGARRPDFEQIANSLGITPPVVFTGRLGHSEALAEIAAADIFCMPSTWESCGKVYLEAMALEKATIGCCTEGPRDFIKNDVTGYLIQPGSVDGIVEVLEKIVRDWPKALRVAAAAKTYVRENCSFERYAEQLMQVYSSSRAQLDRDAVPIKELLEKTRDCPILT